jgi:pyruvate formate lyase activating enzyme
MGANGKPLVVDVKRNSLDDGPGIRSVVFFKGCPLRCVWCQNPESLRADAELLRDSEACVGCRSCVVACPHGVGQPAIEAQVDCQTCGACVDACPAAGRRIAGDPLEVDALAESLLSDAVFYRRSGGGVTLSGGEPTLFPRRVGELAARLRAENVHVLLETCGQFAWNKFAEHLLPHVSTIYFDLKIADPRAHEQWTGTGNDEIHENLRNIVASDHGDVLPRVPLVPGITDREDNLRALAGLVREVGLERIALLPYNPTWLGKRRALGLGMPYAHDRWMSADEVARCESVVESAGLRVVH